MKKAEGLYRHFYSGSLEGTGIPDHTDMFDVYSDAETVVEVLLAGCREFKPLITMYVIFYGYERPVATLRRIEHDQREAYEGYSPYLA